MSLHTHLVIPDLFLPKDIAAEVCAGLRLPALEKILARAQPEKLTAESLETWLCEAFGVAGQAIAPVTLGADGVAPGTAYWLRADPVHLHMERDQLILQPVALSADEAMQLCASLNAHFAADGLHFIAPDPQRWYLRLDSEPGMATELLAAVAGKNIHAHLPQGTDALRWHGILNEIQMLLFEHPVNQAREVRGEWAINSVWLWGGGYATGKLPRPVQRVYTDSPLAAAFAAAADISYAALPENEEQCASYCVSGHQGEMLIVWDGLHGALQHGDLGGWRNSLQHFERSCASPLLQALHNGLIGKITLDVVQENIPMRFVLTRRAAWKFWRRRRRLGSGALV